jgi:hypothetical protein
MAGKAPVVGTSRHSAQSCGWILDTIPDLEIFDKYGLGNVS